MATVSACQRVITQCVRPYAELDQQTIRKITDLDLQVTPATVSRLQRSSSAYFSIDYEEGSGWEISFSSSSPAKSLLNCTTVLYFLLFVERWRSWQEKDAASASDIWTKMEQRAEAMGYRTEKGTKVYALQHY